MAIVLEFAKLVSVTYLHRNWAETGRLLKTYLSVVIVILMFINSLGIYGFLSKSHIQQEVINQSQTSNIEIVQTKLADDQNRLNDVNTQINQIDEALTKLTQTGRAQTSLKESNLQRKQRQSLIEQKTQILKEIEDLTSQKVTQEANNKKLESDFGPLLYLSKMIYGNPSEDQLEATVRWIITIIVCIFDPTALALLIASQNLFLRRTKKQLTIPSKNNTLDLQNLKLG